MISPSDGRAVDQDEVEVVHHRVDGALQLHLPAEGGDQLDLDAGQVDGGGRHEEVLDARGLDAVLQRLVPHDHVVHGELEVPCFHAQPRGGIALGVEVDHQHPVVELGQSGAQVDGGRGLADAALLVGDGDDPGQLPLHRLGPVEQVRGVISDGGRPHGVLGGRGGGLDNLAYACLGCRDRRHGNRRRWSRRCGSGRLGCRGRRRSGLNRWGSRCGVLHVGRLHRGQMGGLGGGRNAHVLCREGLGIGSRIGDGSGLGNGHRIGPCPGLGRSGRLFGLDGLGARTGDCVHGRGAVLVVIVRGNPGLPWCSSLCRVFVPASNAHQVGPPKRHRTAPILACQSPKVKS